MQIFSLLVSAVVMKLPLPFGENGPGNLFLSNLKMSNASVGFLAMFLRPVFKDRAGESCDWRFLAFSSSAKAWAVGRNVKVRDSVASALYSSAMGCVRGQESLLGPSTCKPGVPPSAPAA